MSINDLIPYGNPSTTGSRMLGLCEAFCPGAFDVKSSNFRDIKIVRVEDIGLGEILICVLTSANDHDCGLNMTWSEVSADASAHRSSPQYFEILEQSFISKENSGFQEIDVHE